MLRVDFVKRKIHLISEDLAKLASYKDVPFNAIVSDFEKLAVTERLLERIVSRAIDINEHLIGELARGPQEKTTRFTYKETFLKLADVGVCPKTFAEKIAPSAGLRNILIHDYNDADRHIVYKSIRECLEDYKNYIEYILAFLEKIK